jgi:hypothetical protein
MRAQPLLMAVVLLYSLASCFPRVGNEVRDMDSVAQVNEVNDVPEPRVGRLSSTPSLSLFLCVPDARRLNTS